MCIIRTRIRHGRIRTAIPISRPSNGHFRPFPDRTIPNDQFTFFYKFRHYFTPIPGHFRHSRPFRRHISRPFSVVRRHFTAPSTPSFSPAPGPSRRFTADHSGAVQQGTTRPPKNAQPRPRPLTGGTTGAHRDKTQEKSNRRTSPDHLSHTDHSRAVQQGNTGTKHRKKSSTTATHTHTHTHTPTRNNHRQHSNILSA